MARYYKRRRFNARSYAKRRRPSRRRVCKTRTPKGSKTPIALSHSKKRLALGKDYKKVIMGPHGINYRPHKKGVKKDGTARVFTPAQIENMRKFGERAKNAGGLPRHIFKTAMMVGSEVKAKLVNAEARKYTDIYPNRVADGNRYQKRMTYPKKAITPELQAQVDAVSQNFKQKAAVLLEAGKAQGYTLVNASGNTGKFALTGTIAPPINTTTTSTTASFDHYSSSSDTVVKKQEPYYPPPPVLPLEQEGANMLMDAKKEGGTSFSEGDTIWMKNEIGVNEKMIYNNGRWELAFNQD